MKDQKSTALIKVKGDPEVHRIRYQLYLMQSGYFDREVNTLVVIDHVSLLKNTLEHNKEKITALVGIPKNLMRSYNLSSPLFHRKDKRI